MTFGTVDRFSGDKQLGFGDQRVPLEQAALQPWGGGGWKGQHTQHLADFLVASNPTGDPAAFAAGPGARRPFEVRPKGPYGDGKTED